MDIMRSHTRVSKQKNQKIYLYATPNSSSPSLSSLESTKQKHLMHSSKTWGLPSLKSRKSEKDPAKTTDSPDTSIPRSNTAASKTKKTTKKAWKKTKEFLGSLGEPPTAEWDRQQAEQKMRTSGKEAYGAINYGPYHQGGPYSGRT